MTKFTKGPWYFDAYDNLKSDHAKTATNAIPLYGVCLNGSEEAKANTKLIAAAPELYEALEVMLADYREACEEWIGDARDYGEEVIDEAVKALKKARGES